MASKKKLNDKMSRKKKSGFSLKTLLLLTSLLLGTAIYIDVSHHGSWKDCRMNKALIDSGIHEYTHKALNRTKEGLLWVDEHVEKSFPGVHKTVIDFSEPYVQLTRDLGLVGYNLCANLKKSVVAKYPSVIQTIDSYAPGMIETSQRTICNAWTATTKYYNSGVDYLRKDVFVGQMSPENIQKVIMDALKTTQQKTSEYYHWVYEKIQNTIK